MVLFPLLFVSAPTKGHSTFNSLAPYLNLAVAHSPYLSPSIDYMKSDEAQM